MSKKLKRIIPNVLMALGAVLLLTWGVYTAVNYPWRMLLADRGWAELPTELPDPDPLPPSAQAVFPEGEDDGNGADTGLLPEQTAMFAPRPQMNLEKLGVIRLPRIQISENIVEGSGNELYYGVGHVRGTAMPGEAGNCVLAGHRNYVIMRPFRYLDRMQIGDQVMITDDTRTCTYEVFSMFEIEPDEVWVLQPQEGEEYMLTLLTCTPVLTYSHRLIVRARLVDTQELAAA